MTTRLDSSHPTRTSTRGLANARTRIVGDRTGPFADAIIVVVRTVRGIRRAVAGVFARFASVITPLGWSVLAIVPVAFLTGYWFGWIELVAIAFVGLVLLTVAAVYLIGRTAFAIDLVIDHRSVVVGQPASGTVVVRNPSRRRILGSPIEIPIGTRVTGVTVPGLAAGADFRHQFTIPTVRRGILTVGPVRTVRADPVGIVRREVIWAEEHDLFVHPRTIVLPNTSSGRIRDLEGRPTRELASNDVSFHALREYVPGDERRNIHWKSTAKTGTYMVRQFEETKRSKIVVALSIAAVDYATDDEFEMAVSAAGSLGVRAIRDARGVSVVVGESTPEFAKRKVFGVRQLNSVSRSRLLDDLAGVERSAYSLAMLDVARVAAQKVGGISVAYLVCGSLTRPVDLRAASILFPVGVEVIAVTCDPDTIPGLRRMGGLSVLTIGYLEDLQLALARAAAV